MSWPTTASGRVEAIVHREHPLFGVQFHPEKSGETRDQVAGQFLEIF